MPIIIDSIISIVLVLILIIVFFRNFIKGAKKNNERKREQEKTREQAKLAMVRNVNRLLDSGFAQLISDKLEKNCMKYIRDTLTAHFDPHHEQPDLKDLWKGCKLSLCSNGSGIIFNTSWEDLLSSENDRYNPSYTIDYEELGYARLTAEQTKAMNLAVAKCSDAWEIKITAYGNDIIYNKDMDWEQYVRTAEHSQVEVYGNDQYWQAYVKKEIDRLDSQRTIKPLINVFD